jgi:hypothetical protein
MTVNDRLGRVMATVSICINTQVISTHCGCGTRRTDGCACETLPAAIPTHQGPFTG